MPLIKHDRFVADPWTMIADDAPPMEPGLAAGAVPDGPVIVSAARWRAEPDALRARPHPLGVCLADDDPPEDVRNGLDVFQVIALTFPVFRNGRAYSAARILRERYDYRGELRAVGDVLRDQWLFMRRCGFDAFEVAQGTRLEDWRAAMKEISVTYQPPASQSPPGESAAR